MAQQNVGAHFELGFGDGAQRVLRDGFGAHLGQLPLVHVRVNGEQRFGGDQLQHGISQELETFVVGHAGVLMREGAMGQRLHQQVWADSGAQCLQQFVGRSLAVSRFLLCGLLAHMFFILRAMCCVY